MWRNTHGRAGFSVLHQPNFARHLRKDEMKKMHLLKCGHSYSRRRCLDRSRTFPLMRGASLVFITNALVYNISRVGVACLCEVNEGMVFSSLSRQRADLCVIPDVSVSSQSGCGSWWNTPCTCNFLLFFSSMNIFALAPKEPSLCGRANSKAIYKLWFFFPLLFVFLSSCSSFSSRPTFP